MKTQLPTWMAMATVVMCELPVHSQVQSGPLLSIRGETNQTVRIAWTGSSTPFLLEESDSLVPGSFWQKVSEPAVAVGDEVSVTLNPVAPSRFFRLRTPDLTRIAQTSPVLGETGVSVTRETIFRFNYALATNTVLRSSNVFAEFGGRRYLSRVELSSDRKTVTLFYQEPLPGSARVRVTFEAPGLSDQFGRLVDLDGDGLPGGVAHVEFDTLSLTPLPGTGMIGTVYASEQIPGTNSTDFVNRPLQGVTITVDGMEQSLRTVTDSNGFFRLQPCPVGDFFVHIDGRTVANVAAGIRYPDLAYYPFVGKAWAAVAGRTNNLAGGTGLIYLPLIVAGTLQPVSATEDTMITFPPSVIANNPALAGVSLTVPANSLFSDNGTRGGKVGIAPVPPDRLPGPLPPGLEFPLVITVQTDGPLNFDQPVPICFPNLPDPVLGTPLPAGSKQALISFNHKKGIWEAVGDMTVSADGKMICTDPGFGIIQPGWHGVGPKPDGPPPDCKNCCPIEGQPQVSSLFYSSAHIGQVRNGSTGLHAGATCTPPRPPCKLDPDALGVHFKDCQRRFEACMDEGHRNYLKRRKACLREKNPVLRNQCQLNNVDQSERDIQECNGNLHKCQIRGAQCWGAPSASFKDASEASQVEAGLPAEVSSIRDQILAILDGSRALVEPYVASGSEIPPDVEAQVDALFAEADRLAGGDAEIFLANDISRLERELVEFDETILVISGEIPSYPVLYAAEILRPDSLLYLRGETGPFGQYSLFVPRDGELLSVSFYDPHTKSYAQIYPNNDLQAPYRLPAFTLSLVDPTAKDSDNDGLADAVEFVYGTDPHKADTDGDGIPDGAEVEQGTNPLDGRPTQTGIIATAKTPGSAVDVCAANGLIVTAEGAAGISIFKAYSGDNPTILAHVPTPGIAQRVACSGNLIAVADSAAGLAVIDITDPSAARIVYQLDLGGTAQAVTTAGDLAFVGLSSGQVVTVDLVSGTVLENVNSGAAVHDLGLEGDVLFVLLNSQLRAYSFTDGTLQFLGGSDPPGFFAEGITGLRRLFVGGGYAYVTSYPGYDTYDVRNPAAMAHVGFALNSGPNSFKQIVLNGSGLGVAVVGVNPRDDGTHDVYLYDVSNPAVTTGFLTVLPTPGLARAVCLYNGLAYVADGTAGLQVVNYLPYDNRGANPTISLSASFALTNGVVEEGKWVRVTARVTDDVQVRNVEFYVDGMKVLTDGNFPFEHRFLTPALSATKSNLTLRACAFDTGGNSACTATYTLTLVPDATPPVVRRTLPAGNTVSASAPTVFAYFSEPIDLSTLNGANFRLTFAGADNKLDTADDMPAGGTISWRDTLNAAVLSFSPALPFGLYRGTLTTGLKDLAGNPLQSPFNWTFWILPGGPDGDEDNDDLTNAEEATRGTNPLVADTAGDGWLDGVEVADGTDPLDPNSTPRINFVGRPPVDVVLPSFDELGTTGIGLTMGGPPVEAVFPSIDEVDTGTPGVTIGRPPVEAVFPAFDEIDATGGLTIGRPPIEVVFPSLDEVNSGSGVTIGRPPIEVVFPALDEIDSILTGITLGRPPVSIRYVP